jgi:hypothetical protein
MKAATASQCLITALIIAPTTIITADRDAVDVVRTAEQMGCVRRHNSR